MKKKLEIQCGDKYYTFKNVRKKLYNDHHAYYVADDVEVKV